MRAWCITQAGGPEVLRLETLPDPQPGPEEVCVRVAAIGVNRADVLQRRGVYPAPPWVEPRVPGLEYSGVVERTGARCRLRKPGEVVMGLVPGGAYAEYVTVQERATIAVPAGLTLAEAAAIPEAFLTAYRALYLEGGLAHGEWLLIRAVTSGVGIAAAQLARVFGNRSIGTSRSAERLEKLRSPVLDASCVEGRGELPARVREITAGEGVSVVLDLVGGGHLAENLACLREEGTLVLAGLLAGREDRIDLGAFLSRRLKLKAMTMRSLPLERRIGWARLFESRLAPLFAERRLMPVVDASLPFAEAPAAHRRMETGGHFGKIVLVLPSA